jgi:hypothetical protein
MRAYYELNRRRKRQKTRLLPVPPRARPRRRPRPRILTPIEVPDLRGHGFVQFTGDQDLFFAHELAHPTHWYSDLADAIACVGVAVGDIFTTLRRRLARVVDPDHGF